jgi:Holliday junction resolvasome RuvABC endonuclease subunit
VALLDGSLETRRLIPTGEDLREKLGSLALLLEDLFTEIRSEWIDSIVIESVIYTRYKVTSQKMLMVHGLLLATLGRLQIADPVMYVHPTTLKRLVLGVAGPGTCKADVVQTIQAVCGLELQHDEADAAALAYIGRGVGSDNMIHPTQHYTRLRCDVIEDRVLKQFGHTLAETTKARRERARESRRRYKTGRTLA